MAKNSTGPVSLQRSAEGTDRDPDNQPCERFPEDKASETGEISVEETPRNQGITNNLPDRSCTTGGNRSRTTGGNQSKSAWGNAFAKLQETARQLGMDTVRRDPTRRNINFDDEADDSTIKQKANSRLPSEDSHLRTSNDPTNTFAAANTTDSTILRHNNSRPNRVTPHNPYSTGRTPLTDRDLCQANDFYLGGRFGKDDGDELEALYDVLNLPKNWFPNVLYTFIRVLQEEETPYLNDKEIKNLPRLANLEPETVVDWYEDMESELMMISTISLLPFDAIVINWQYVGLCIPGIGERRYLEMARVLWRVCEKTLPRELEAVRTAFKVNTNLGRDGFKLLWDVLIRSQPAFNPSKAYPKPTWYNSRDVSTLAKRWILYFRFMSKSPDVGYLSDTEQSTYFLRSIQEPSLISQAQSLLVSIINENQLVPIMNRGRAQLPTHLKIPAMADTLAQTIQPIENDLDFAPTANLTQQMAVYGHYPHLQPPFGLGTLGQPSPYPNHGPISPYMTASTPIAAFANQHVMQGGTEITDAAGNWTERRRGQQKKDGKPRDRDGAKTPDKPPKPKVVCEACFVRGHEAVNCWALARALLTQSFIRNLVDKSILDKVKENYKQRFQPPEHARANKMCQDLLWSYCVDNKVTAEQVCTQMNWGGLANGRNDSDAEDEVDDDSSDEERESPDKV